MRKSDYIYVTIWIEIEDWGQGFDLQKAKQVVG
jgi:hypothetical protein